MISRLLLQPLFLQTRAAKPFEIHLDLVDVASFLKTVGMLRRHLWHVVEVKNLATLAADEMCMRPYVTVVADVMVVDGYHLCCAALRVHTQRVVHRGARECGDERTEGCVYLINRGMCSVCEEVLHDGNTLRTGAYPASHETLMGFGARLLIWFHHSCFVGWCIAKNGVGVSEKSQKT